MGAGSAPNTPPGDPGHSLAHSRALRRASLRSEVTRAYTVMGILVLVMLPLLLLGWSEELGAQIKAVSALTGLTLFGVQLSALAFALWATRRDLDIPAWFTLGSLVIESLVPTGVIYMHIQQGTFPPYSALVAPPIVAYGLLSCLTTLRLRPALCLLAGGIGAASYLALLLHVRFGLGIAVPTTGLPLVAYVNVAILIFISAVGAAWVARELRTHMEAALGEAETRSRMERMQQDLVVASSIQRALLPRAAPAISGFDIAGWNRPADQTGGDYYDWQGLSDGTWIVTLADVSGHGVGPALVTAGCRAYMRASSLYHKDLASLASHVNRLLAEDLSEGRFVTMASVLIDPGSGAVAMLSAGHGPVVLYVSATKEMQDIMPSDMPLAIAPDAVFSPARLFTLAPGDMLALVTDGFVEWTRSDGNGGREQFGIERLRDSLRRHAALPAAELIDAVAADAAQFARGEPQQDDLTMVVIRRAEPASTR